MCQLTFSRTLLCCSYANFEQVNIGILGENLVKHKHFDDIFCSSPQKYFVSNSIRKFKLFNRFVSIASCVS